MSHQTTSEVIKTYNVVIFLIYSYVLIDP